MNSIKTISAVTQNPKIRRLGRIVKRTLLVVAAPFTGIGALYHFRVFPVKEGIDGLRDFSKQRPLTHKSISSLLFSGVLPNLITQSSKYTAISQKSLTKVDPDGNLWPLLIGINCIKAEKQDKDGLLKRPFVKNNDACLRHSLRETGYAADEVNAICTFLQEKARFSFSQFIKMSLLGLGLGIGYKENLIKLLGWLWPQKGIVPGLKKMLFAQSWPTLLVQTFYFSFTYYFVRQEGWEGTKAYARDTWDYLKKTIPINWAYWGICDALTFGVVPQDSMLYVSNIQSLLWFLFLGTKVLNQPKSNSVSKT